MASEAVSGTGSPLSMDHQIGWPGLISYVKSRTVVPVVGRHLLEVEDRGEFVPVEAWIATRVADRLRIPLDGLPSPSLRDVWARAEDIKGALASIRVEARGVIAEGLPEPPAVAQLGAITDLPLFVSTTVDPTLEQAIKRAQGVAPTVLCVDPAHPLEADLPHPEMPETGTTVFAMLGRLSDRTPSYAVTDVDVLERVTLLLQREARPPNLFSVLSKSNLLLLGCGFPDWLARFVVRGLFDTPLSDRRDFFAYLIDARADPDLVLFLENNNLKCLVFSGGPRAFVDELHKRWSADRAQRPRDGDRVSRDSADVGARPTAPTGVFLSYASEDRAQVKALADHLERAGVPTWMDKRGGLTPGAHWDADIAEAVARCDAFVICASREAVRQVESYFYKEWRLALEREKSVAFGERFVFPVALDAVDLHDPHVSELKDLQWTSLAGQDAAAQREALAKELKAVVRARRMKGRFE